MLSIFSSSCVFSHSLGLDRGTQHTRKYDKSRSNGWIGPLSFCMCNERRVRRTTDSEGITEGVRRTKWRRRKRGEEMGDAREKLRRTDGATFRLTSHFYPHFCPLFSSFSSSASHPFFSLSLDLTSQTGTHF